MIRRFILNILANWGALYATFVLLQGDFAVSGSWKGYLIAAVLFGFLNGFIKPVIKILSLPFVLITAGLFTLVINMFIVWFAKYALDVLAFQGVAITVNGGWPTYLYIGVLLAIANMFIHWLIRSR